MKNPQEPILSNLHKIVQGGEKMLIEKEKKLEEKKLDPDTNYFAMKGLRTEAMQKLAEIKPLTVGAASRISGVNPADITILLMNLKNN